MYRDPSDSRRLPDADRLSHSASVSRHGALAPLDRLPQGLPELVYALERDEERSLV
jgi:hypothetical protein